MTGEPTTSAGHRNNAAEWVMWFCLLPVFALVWVWERIKRSGDAS